MLPILSDHSGVEILSFLLCFLLIGPPSVRGAVNGGLVQNNQFAVAGGAYVHFDLMRTGADRLSPKKRGGRVLKSYEKNFRCNSCSAEMPGSPLAPTADLLYINALTVQGKKKRSTDFWRRHKCNVIFEGGPW